MNTSEEWIIKKTPPVFWIFVLAIIFAVVYATTAYMYTFPGTISIMVVNICVTLLIWIKKISIEDFASTHTGIYSDKQFYRTLTAAFTHVSPIHILMNLVSLYNIGSVLEPYISSKRFLILYFIVLIIGGFLSAFIHKSHHPNVLSIGASGAICGLLGIYISIIIMLYDEHHLSSMIPTIGILCLQIFWKQIDSIAHFSGLITGIIVGITYLKLLGY